MSVQAHKDEILNLIKELRILFRTTADGLASDQPELSAVLLQAGKTLKKFYSQLMTDRLVVAFAGLTNVGKSTLMNALLGANLAPRSNRPWSSAPVEYVYGNEMGATVIFGKSITRYIEKCSSVEELGRLIERSASDNGDLSQRGIKKMEVRLKAKILEDGLVVADTPGFGAVQDGERKEAHGKSLFEYLPKANQVFWIISSEQGITAKEMDFHDNYLKDTCDNVIVNIFDDEYSEDDKKRFLGRYAHHVNFAVRWHFVSALYALNAKMAGDHSGLYKSGIRSIEESLWRLASPENRKNSILQDILNLCDDIGSHISSEYPDQRHIWPETSIKSVAYSASFSPDIKEKITANLIRRK